MKIKYNGYTSFTFNVDNLVIVTDPALAKENGIKGVPSDVDVVVNVNGQGKYESKPVNRSSVFEIGTPGEFEISGFMVQRPIGSNHYVFDFELIRVVYVGMGTKNLDVKQIRDLGDVDVLLLPYSDGENFPSYELLQDIISKIEPTVLVPYGIGGEGSKSKDDFIKYFGFINSTSEKVLKVESKPEAEDRNMKVIFLD